MISIFGDSDKVPVNIDGDRKLVAILCDHFAMLQDNCFLDQSRKSIMDRLGLTLYFLSQNELSGRYSCFVLCGVAGVGKSRFLRNLGIWFTKIGGKDSAFLYLSMADVSSFSLAEFIFDRYEETQRTFPFARNEATVRKIWDYFVERGWVLFLVLDKYDRCYSQVWVEQLLMDLYFIGDRDGPRPISVVLTGSSPYLRALVYNKYDGDKPNGFLNDPKYYMNLNSTKFVAITQLPFASIDDCQEVLRTISDELSRVGFEQKEVDEPPPPPPQLVTSDFEWWCVLLCSRGRAYEIAAYLQNRVPLKRSVESSLADIGAENPIKSCAWSTDNMKILRALWEAVKVALTPVEFAGLFSKMRMISGVELPSATTVSAIVNKLRDLRIPFSRLVEVVSTGSIYNAAGQGLVQLDTENCIRFVHFSDVFLVADLFSDENKLNGIGDFLTWDEKISLLNPDNSSADEVNELLVAKSLASNGLTVPGIGKLTFRVGDTLENCNIGYVRNSGTTAFSKIGDDTIYVRDKCGKIERAFIGGGHKIQSALLRKEYVDEFGSDLIAIFETPSGKKVLEVYKFLVVRIQIKLGMSNSHVGNPFEEMIQHEEKIQEALIRNKSVAKTLFIKVLWTSRPTSSLSNPNAFQVVIGPDNMLAHWSPPVRAYVVSANLTSYGAKDPNTKSKDR